MRKCVFVSLILLVTQESFSQKSGKEFLGTYTDSFTTLTLIRDSTFEISTQDVVFPYTSGNYVSKGTWVIKGDTVILNPSKRPRLPRVSVAEQELAGQNSVQVQLSFFRETYRAEEKISTTAFPFEMVTLYFNRRKDYFNLRPAPVLFRSCLFAPPIRHVRILDSVNSAKLPPQKVQKIGVFTYGFENAVEVPIQNPKANSFQITIVQTVDEEQMPRSKKVILKRGVAYYYEREGKINTSEWKTTGLKKVE